VSSSFASSMPATSPKVTFSFVGSYFRAFAWPNENIPPTWPPARCMTQYQRPKKRKVGPMPTSSVSHHGVPAGDLAVTATPLSASSRSRLPLFAKFGIWVAKSVARTAVPPLGR